MNNLTGYDNVTSLNDMAIAAGATTGGLAWGMVLFVIAIIVFIVFKNYDTKAVILGDSFICTVLAVLMWGAEWIGFNILVWPIIMLFVSILAYIFWPE